jgi:hypothetical protein
LYAGGEEDVHWAAQATVRQYERAAAQVAARQSAHAAVADQQAHQASAGTNAKQQPHQQRPVHPLHSTGMTADAAAVVEAIAAAEPSVVQEVPPRFSTHTCVGGKPEDNWHSTTCKFDNVCLDAANGQFEYYLDPAVVGGGARSPLASEHCRAAASGLTVRCAHPLRHP